MKKKSTGVESEREAIKEYLQQYHVAWKKKRILEERRRVLSSELAAPTGSSFGAAASRRSRGANAEGSVSVVFRIVEVEERIEGQREDMAKAVLHVMDLIDLLPAGSMERTVVEMRHIDCKNWERIAREVYMSRTAAINYYNAALDKLLGFKRTVKLLEDFRKTGKNCRA